MGKGLLIWVSFLAGLHVLTGAAMLGDWVGEKRAGALTILVAAADVSTAVYRRGLYTPVPDHTPDQE